MRSCQPLHPLLASTLLLLLLLPHVQPACDLIVHVQSATSKPFQAQVTAPSGQKSERWSFTKSGQKQSFQRKAANCTEGQWQIQTFSGQAQGGGQAQVSLSGIGRVLYEVHDDLVPVQTERQGAICQGSCAPLGVTTSPKRKSSSSSGNSTGSH